MAGKRPDKNIERKKSGAGRKGEESPLNMFKATRASDAGVQVTEVHASGDIGRSDREANRLRDFIRPQPPAPEAGKGKSIEQRSETHAIASGSEDMRLNRTFKNYTTLRGYVDKISREGAAKRALENPKPTETELQMGIYREALPLQFQTAIPDMFEKGYNTWASGARISAEPFQWSEAPRPLQAVPEGTMHQVREDFPNQYIKGEGIETYQIQQVDGRFSLEQDTIRALNNEGFQVEIEGEGDTAHTRIFFDPGKIIEGKPVSLKTIKERCDRIAAILPDKHRLAPPSMSEDAIAFRRRHQDTNVASRAVPGAINIPERPARETYTSSSGDSTRPSSNNSAAASFDIDL